MDPDKQDRNGKHLNRLNSQPTEEQTLASICKLLNEIARIESTTGPSEHTIHLHAEIERLRGTMKLQEQSH